MMTKLVCMLRFQVRTSFEGLYMRAAISLLFLFFTNGILGEEISVPKTFVDGEVAEAADFNANFDYLEEKVKALSDGAPWLVANRTGATRVEVDCSSDPMALVDAYQANMTVRHLNLAAKGDCYGAIDLFAYTDDDDLPTVTNLQTKGQAYAIFPQDGATLKIIPRPIVVGESTYYLSRLYASFGNMLGVSNLTLEMGVDDSYALLFSRSSNGDVVGVEIVGATDPTGDQNGIRIQNGANTYVGNVTISGVLNGVSISTGASLNVYGLIDIRASNYGIGLFNGGFINGRFDSESSISGDVNAINFNLGGVAFLNGDGQFVDGAISLSGGATLAIFGDLSVGENTRFSVQQSTLYGWTTAETSGITVDMLSCQGSSLVAVIDLELRNQANSGCLDQVGWAELMNSAQDGSSKTQSSNLSKFFQPVSPPFEPAGAFPEAIPIRFGNKK